MTELINRPQYLNQLIQNKDVDLVKIVTGIRRCGKSSLLDLFHQYLLEQGVPDSHIIHMNLESLRYRDLTDYLSFYDYVSKQIAEEGKTCFDLRKHGTCRISAHALPARRRKQHCAQSAEIFRRQLS